MNAAVDPIEPFRAEARAWLEANCPAEMRKPIRSDAEGGVQMPGGVGMTDEYDIGLYMKQAGVLSQMFGDADFHADQLARLHGY